MEHEARDFAGTLVEIAHDCIPENLSGELEQPLRFRRGRGKRTYHCLDDGEHRITIGPEMVRQHLVGDVHGWLNYRERNRLGWPVPCSIPTLLTHVVLHEAAHAVQIEQGGRRYGSVHNATFYRILASLPGHGWASELEAAIRTAYPDEAIQETPDKPERPQPPKIELPPLPLGRQLAIDYQGVRFNGIIERRNPKTVTILGAWESGRRARIRVPYPLLPSILVE
ncbi:hypothetical protein [Thioalkalivibrio sp. ALE19]|uniref:hypothetical protein n=1 Tax=Thioalkalivibrio sp. ALE19 TaxID=1266909 RepID=UPI0003FD6139|nr:hypothetical protein [Thioalkalivibrio sp. ALE19]